MSKIDPPLTELKVLVTLSETLVEILKQLKEITTEISLVSQTVEDVERRAR